MRFKNIDNTYTDLQLVKATYNYKPHFKLVEKSNGRHASIDRGVATDKFNVNITLAGTKEYVKDVLKQIHLNKNVLEIDELEEPVFGDVLGTAQTFNCTVTEHKDIESVNKNSSSISLTLNINKPSIFQYVQFPDIKCMSADYSISNEYKSTFNDTYSGPMYNVHRGNVLAKFNGRFILRDEEVKLLYGFWYHNRGKGFIINDDSFGISNMFGPVFDDNVHKVIITNISTERLSPTMRSVELTLIKEQ